MPELNATNLSRLTLLNTAMLVINGVMLIGLLTRGEPEFATTAPQTTAASEGTPPRPVGDGPALDGVRGFLDATITPLVDAARDHGISEDSVLPSDDAVVAAVASGSMESAETQAVVETLKAGYAEFNMPFPEVRLPEPEVSVSDGAPPRDGGEAVEAWAVPTIAHLRESLEQKGESEAGLVPTDEELAAAVSSGSFDSEASRWMVDKLKNGYARFDMDFPEPGEGDGAALEPTPAVGEVEQEMLRAYFQANTQRLKLMAGKQGVAEADVVPDPETVSAAVASGDISSPAAQPALQQLREAYERVGLEFREPVVVP